MNGFECFILGFGYLAFGFFVGFAGSWLFDVVKEILKRRAG